MTNEKAIEVLKAKGFTYLYSNKPKATRLYHFQEMVLYPQELRAVAKAIEILAGKQHLNLEQSTNFICSELAKAQQRFEKGDVDILKNIYILPKDKVDELGSDNYLKELIHSFEFQAIKYDLVVFGRFELNFGCEYKVFIEISKKTTK